MTYHSDTKWKTNLVTFDAFLQVPVVGGPNDTDYTQVWPLTQFFPVFFLQKIIDLPEGQINDPSAGKHYSLPFRRSQDTVNNN